MEFLFITGSAFLIITTLILIVVLPKYNSIIDNLTKKISNLSDGIKEKEFQFRDFQGAESKIVNMRSMLMLFESSNLQQSKAYNKLKNELYGTRKNSLVMLAAAADIVKSHEEMNELSNQWKTKNFDELEKTKEKYSNRLGIILNGLLADQKKLEKNYQNKIKIRNIVNLVGGLLQGIALFLLAFSEYLANFK